MGYNAFGVNARSTACEEEKPMTRDTNVRGRLTSPCGTFCLPVTSANDFRSGKWIKGFARRFRLCL
jgi:hypothetical protein